MLARQLFTLLLAAHGAPAHAGHPANSVDMTKKSCEASGGTPSCAGWCDSNFLQQHCPDCQCSACDFCQDAKETCEPLPNSDDTRVQQCQPFCNVDNKKQRALRGHATFDSPCSRAA